MIGPRALIALVTLAACGGGGADDAVDAAPGDPSILAGAFELELDPADQSTTLLGKVYDGPTPAAIVWETTSSSGDCTLYTPRVPFCETPCGGGVLCVEDDVCQAFPSGVDVGTVSFDGLTDDVRVDPVASAYQLPIAVTLGWPPAAEGATVTLTADGDVIPGFSIASRGIAPLVLGDATLTLEREVPLALAWTAPGLGDVARIAVKLDISHHGGSKGMILCDTADDGAVELSAPLITALLDLGVAGFPTVIVSRRAVGQTTITAGRVELVLASEVERDVIVPGLISCLNDDPCPDGTTCQDDLRCE